MSGSDSEDLDDGPVIKTPVTKAQKDGIEYLARGLNGQTYNGRPIHPVWKFIGRNRVAEVDMGDLKIMVEFVATTEVWAHVTVDFYANYVTNTKHHNFKEQDTCLGFIILYLNIYKKIKEFKLLIEKFNNTDQFPHLNLILKFERMFPHTVFHSKRKNSSALNEILVDFRKESAWAELTIGIEGDSSSQKTIECRDIKSTFNTLMSNLDTGMDNDYYQMAQLKKQ